MTNTKQGPEGSLETVELETGSPAAGSVIWLHGLGADGHDFEPIVPALRLHELRLRFVFPHAPVRAVTINGGVRMRAWYDVMALELGAAQDEAGMRESAAAVHELIRREGERGIPAARIVLAGFSQGGAIALHAALRHPQGLAGVIALSTYLPLAESFDAEAHPANRATPIFMGHGTSDPLVPLALGETTMRFLDERNYTITWRTYPMAHAVCPEEVLDTRAWLLEHWRDGTES